MGGVALLYFEYVSTNSAASVGRATGRRRRPSLGRGSGWVPDGGHIRLDGAVVTVVVMVVATTTMFPRNT